MPDDIFAEWLKRLGLEPTSPPTVETLRHIVQVHQHHFPFENIDVFCGGVPSLDFADIAEKLIRNRRGGYCFELSAVLGAGLAALGFDVRPLMARVIWQRDAPGPKTHTFLRVEAGAKSWLVDVGFGGPGPLEPIEMNVEGSPTEIGDVAYRLEEKVDLGSVLARRSRRSAWAPLYAFNLERIGPDDLAAGNRLAATARDSIFRQGLKIARQSPRFRMSLSGRAFKRYVGTDLETKTLPGSADVLECLVNDFEIELDPATERALIKRLEAGG